MTDLRTNLRAIAQRRAHISVAATVNEVNRISASFVRVRVTSPEFTTYVEPHPGDAFKLVMPLSGPKLPEVANDEHGLLRVTDETAVTTRALTVRTFDASAGHMVFDIVDHAGALRDWWQSAKEGHEVLVSGMRPEFAPVEGVGHYVFAADPTAVPAVAAIVESLPETASATAVLAVDDESDKSVFPEVTGVDVVWAKPGFAEGEAHPLFEALSGVAHPGGRVVGWGRAESGVMRALRPLFLDQLSLQRGDVSLSAYWKAGMDQIQGATEVQKRMMALAEQGADITSYDTLEQAELDLNSK